MAELKPCKCGKIHKIKCEANLHSPTCKLYWAVCEDCDMYACANTEQELVNSWNSYVEMNLKPNYNECPWCNNYEKFEMSVMHIGHSKGEPEYQVVCSKCGAKGPIASTEEQAIDAWNKRS